MFGSTFESIFEGASIGESSDYEARMLIESVEKEAEEELEKEKEVAIAVSDADEKDVESLEEATLELEIEYSRLEEATVKAECELAMRAATLKFRNVTEGVDISEGKEELKSLAEASMSGAVEKVKNFFKKVWAKIVAFLKRMRSYFDQIFMKNKDFVKKYEKDVMSANLAGFTIKEYPVINYLGNMDKTDRVLAQISDLPSVIVGYTEVKKGESSSDKVEELKLDIANSLSRGKVSNSSDLDMKTELINIVTDGDDSFEKEELEYGNSEASRLLNYISLNKSISKAIDDGRKATDKFYANAIKEIEKAANESKDESVKSGYGITKDLLSYGSSQFTKAVDQIVATNKMCLKSSRNIVGAMYRYGSKGKGEKANESTSLLDKYL